MFTLVRNTALSVLLLTASSVAMAIPVSLEQSQDITQNGQTFQFVFGGLEASDGTGGQFNFFARGDFTHSSERARVELDLLGGRLVVDENGVVQNNIAGLSLIANNSLTQTSGTDNTLNFLFGLNGAAFDAILIDSTINVTVQNSPGVGDFNNPNHEVRVGFNYSTADVGEVPEPGTLALLGMGGLLAGVYRRRKHVQL